MKKFYQKEWFGIPFDSFAGTASRHIADAEFYELFYEKFYKKYSAYSDLPEDWLNRKDKAINFIADQAKDHKEIISIGCGNGYIEYALSKKGFVVTAVEPSDKATKFLKDYEDVNIYNGYFPYCMNKEKTPSFSFGYMCAIDYVLGQKELLDLVKSAKDYPVNDLMLLCVSYYTKYSPWQYIKDQVIEILSFLKLRDEGQFWGYMRNPDELIDIFRRAGYEEIETGFVEENFFWIRGCNN